jgi:hypothetical protein
MAPATRSAVNPPVAGLRGGSGNCGIVTSFAYRLFPCGPEIYGGALAWRGEDARQVLDAYREFSAAASRELRRGGVAQGAARILAAEGGRASRGGRSVSCGGRRGEARGARCSGAQV